MCRECMQGLTLNLNCDTIYQVSTRMTAYEMVSKMIKKPRPDAVARLEKAQEQVQQKVET